MPKIYGGIVEHDEKLKQKLIDKIKKWKKSPENVEEIALEIASAANVFQSTQHEKGRRKQHEKALKKYSEALQSARTAWLELPDEIQQLMPTLFSCVGRETLLPEEQLRTLAVNSFDHVSLAHLPKEERVRRRKELKEHEWWGSDFELLEMMRAVARLYEREHLPESYSRQRPADSFILKLAAIFDKYQLKVSASDKSRFMGIARLALANESLDKKTVEAALTKRT